MNKNAAASSRDGRDRIPSTPIRRPIETCGRRTTISLDDGFTFDTGPSQRVVAFLTSRSAGDKSVLDLAVAAAVCRDDGTLVHKLDDPLAGLPFGACVGAAINRNASWHRSLGAALRNVDVVAAPDTWVRRHAAEAVHAGFATLDWGSTRDIAWNALGLPSDHIDAIRDHVRYLRRRRRPLDECHFLLAVLTQPGPQEIKPPLAQLLAAVDAGAV